MAPAAGPYKQWILDLDVKGYFDNVDHRHLMYALQDRIKDQEVQDLIWFTLKAGVKENGSVQVTGKGTPQGGIVSPLLANVYLNELDQWIQKWTDGKRGGPENWAYVRYTDDFLIMTDGRKHRAMEMMEEVENFLSEELRLNLSPEKSSLTHAQDGVSFLGYEMQADSTSGGCMTYIPQEAKEYIRSRIKEAMGGGTDVSARLKLKSVNAVVRGWANYYKYCTEAAKIFNDVGHYLWIRTIDWLCWKYECSKSRLIQRKLDNKIPIRINGVTLVDLNGMSTIRTESPRRHSHPYLDKERERPPESQWGKSRRTEHPGPDPYLANSEEREGSADLAFEARLRDGNECQAKGCDAGGMNKKSLPVHHIRRRRSEDDDRLENMVTLCRRCHRKHHHTDQVVKVYLQEKEKPHKLS